MNRRYLLFVLVDEPVRIPGEPGDAQPDSGGVTVLRPHPGAARPDGSPRIELYLSDQLHFRPAAYEELARILKPVLTKAFETP